MSLDFTVQHIWPPLFPPTGLFASTLGHWIWFIIFYCVSFGSCELAASCTMDIITPLNRWQPSYQHSRSQVSTLLGFFLFYSNLHTRNFSQLWKARFGAGPSPRLYAVFGAQQVSLGPVARRWTATPTKQMENSGCIPLCWSKGACIYAQHPLPSMYK